jgi:hypothetical protein
MRSHDISEARPEPSVAESASTWMQVVFGGISVSVAIAGLVIAYFAWVRPHSPAGDDPAVQPVAPSVAAGIATEHTTTKHTAAGTTAPNTAAAEVIATTPPSRMVALGDLPAEIGGGNLRHDGANLMMACATGQSADRQREVRYDLAGRYSAMTAKITVAKAPDGDSQLQLKIFTDDLQAEVQTLSKGTSGDLSVPLTGVQKLRVELTCQSRAGELAFHDPHLTHI